MRQLFLYPGYALNQKPSIELIRGIIRPNHLRKNININLKQHDYITFDNQNYTLLSSLDLKPNSSTDIKVENLDVLSLKNQEIDTTPSYDAIIGLYNFVMSADGRFDKISDFKGLEKDFNLENTTNKIVNDMMFKETQKKLLNSDGDHIILSEPKILYKELETDNPKSFYEKKEDAFTGNIYWSGLVLKK